MIGVYKITSPSGRVYIGQSIDILNRFYQYKSIKRDQTRLVNSFNKYSFNAHKLEVIEECSIGSLNERERFWQDFFDSAGANGLNCYLTGTRSRSGVCPDHIKEKIRKTKMGYKSKLKGRTNTANKGMKYVMPYSDKIILDLNTGVFYKSISDAAEHNNVNKCTLRSYLIGARKNKMKHLILTKNT